MLLILAFMLARPSSLILLDAPDAHLHVLLQKELYDVLRVLCHETKSQLVIATHSEVLIDNTSPRQILSFYNSPHPLASEVDRNQLREALKRVNSLELLLLENAKGILYVEGSTEFPPMDTLRFLLTQCRTTALRPSGTSRIAPVQTTYKPSVVLFKKFFNQSAELRR